MSLGTFCPRNISSMGTIDPHENFVHAKILSWEYVIHPCERFFPGKILSMRTFDPVKILFAENFVLRTRCTQEHVVPRNILSKGKFHPGEHLFLGTFFPTRTFHPKEHFVPGTCCS